MNIPNLLTLIRIILTPLFVIFMIQGRYLAALMVFTGAGITDALDGVLARWLKQKTTIGSVLDPIADKALLSTSYVVTAMMHMVPPWLAVVVISRDMIILLGVLILFLFKGGIDIRPSVLGKLTTLVQLGTVFTVLAGWVFGDLHQLGTISIYICGAITIFSGLHYMYQGIQLLNASE